MGAWPETSKPCVYTRGFSCNFPKSSNELRLHTFFGNWLSGLTRNLIYLSKVVTSFIEHM